LHGVGERGAGGQRERSGSVPRITGLHRASTRAAPAPQRRLRSTGAAAG
jgi:hypothetical protein